MSAPPAWTLYTPCRYAVEPLIAGAPMSTACCGAGNDSELIATCETAAVVAKDTLWLVVAMPMYAVAPSPMVLLAMISHDVPFAEEYAVTVVPALTSLTQ